MRPNKTHHEDTESTKVSDNLISELRVRRAFAVQKFRVRDHRAFLCLM